MFQIYPRRSSRPSCAQLASPAGQNTPKLNTTLKSRKILQSDEDFFRDYFLFQRGTVNGSALGIFIFALLQPERWDIPRVLLHRAAAPKILPRGSISPAPTRKRSLLLRAQASTVLRQNRRSIGAPLRTQCQASPWVSAATLKRSMRHRTLQASGPHRAEHRA